jgi:hypothetical protein
MAVTQVEWGAYLDAFLSFGSILCGFALAAERLETIIKHSLRRSRNGGSVNQLVFMPAQRPTDGRENLQKLTIAGYALTFDLIGPSEGWFDGRKASQG